MVWIWMNMDWIYRRRVFPFSLLYFRFYDKDNFLMREV